MPSNHVVKAFLNDLNTAQPAPSDIVVWDVGANDGGWSNRLMQLLPERHRNATRLSVFEPQPRFADELTSLAARWSGTFHAVAAATADGSLNFFAPPRNASKADTVVASLLDSNRPSVAKEQISVPAIDLAVPMLRLRPDEIVLIKLDVEGYEFELLPHLLVSGALCLVDYLHIEWHPSVLPQARLSKGLALGEAMNLVLRACARPPRAIGHEGLSERQLRQFQKYALGCAGGLKPT